MRLLLVSDLHYTLRQYDWVLSNADRFDLVVIARHLTPLGEPRIDRLGRYSTGCRANLPRARSDLPRKPFLAILNCSPSSGSRFSSK